MEGKTVAIPAGWAVADTARRHFPWINILETDSPVDSLRRVLDGEAFATLDNVTILRYLQRHYFLEGLQYHTEVDFQGVAMPDNLQMFVQPGETGLAALLNRAIAAIGPEQRSALAAKWLQPGSAQDETPSTGTVPSRALIDMAGTTELHGQLMPVQFQGEPHFAYAEPLLKLPGRSLYLGVLVPRESVLGPFQEKVLLSIGITAGFLFLLLPLSWAFASPIVRPIKQLELENDKVRDRRYDEVQRAHSRIREIDDLSESMVEMVEAIRAHERAQRALMDSFIQLIAQAIDDKSAYTGGHCERVPELALMLAESATRSDLPAFRDFDLSDEERWREYRIAAWLHDCGKITTPEHVVDKGSKLETIYNRIHEVRMRFEVLWRDAEINYLRGLLDNPQDEPRLRQTLEQVREQLQDDFRFVANCNVGGEFLDPDDQERLRNIAGITWQRHFDDRLGLSPVDELRLPDTPAPDLPATEQLLADKPEHLIQRDRSTDYPPELGIRMEVPQYLYNLGELYNLSISRGTLTAEDRFKINEHMISTIKMLESLPFPEELKNVPRYASTHHETMKGSGYPRKLPGEALSIPERLLAVADVFEALTASDRPYKKAKSVSEAIDILHKMVLDNHIDRDSFELFLREGVYKRYAERFLEPAQIDDVDVEKYLAAA
jgi:HD-GYP domain-containing protein (c-di-GMP phosphodiesterase class II)